MRSADGMAAEAEGRRVSTRTRLRSSPAVVGGLPPRPVIGTRSGQPSATGRPEGRPSGAGQSAAPRDRIQAQQPGTARTRRGSGGHRHRSALAGRWPVRRRRGTSEAVADRQTGESGLGRVVAGPQSVPGGPGVGDVGAGLLQHPQWPTPAATPFPSSPGRLGSATATSASPRAPRHGSAVAIRRGAGSRSRVGGARQDDGSQQSPLAPRRDRERLPALDQVRGTNRGLSVPWAPARRSGTRRAGHTSVKTTRTGTHG